MVFKFKDIPAHKIDETLSIVNLFSFPDKDFTFVVGELDGFHGTIVNSKNQKYYYIIDGEAKVVIENETYDVSKGDFVCIDKNQKHSIEGKVTFGILCLPPYDFNSETVT